MTAFDDAPHGWGILIVVLAVGASVGCSSNGKSPVEWTSAFDADGTGWLMTVAGRSGGPVWTGGGTPEDGRIERRDDGSWRDAEIPEEAPLVNWLHVFDEGPVVGATRDGGILWRRDGSWQYSSSPTDQDLWGVWGESPEDVWAVGGDVRESNRQVILRFDGSSWESVEIPDLSANNVGAFFKVWGTGAQNVYIVGANGTVVHWDGESLEEEPVETEHDLISLWGAGPDAISVVGGRGNGVLAHWDGSTWSTHSLAPLARMNGIWVRDRQTAWVAGGRGAIARLDPTVSSPEPEVTRVGSQRDFHAVFGVPSAGLFAVGGNLTEKRGPYRGLAFHRPSLD